MEPLPLEPLPLDPLPVDPLPVEVPSSTAVRLSLASVRLSSASFSVRRADEGSRVAISWPFLTCWPTLTSTLCSVPEVPKFSVSSTPGSTSPLPETVLWTTPLSAVTSCLDVRDVLAVDVPSWVMPKMTTAAATPASSMMYQGGTDRRLRFECMAANLRADSQRTSGKA